MQWEFTKQINRGAAWITVGVVSLTLAGVSRAAQEHIADANTLVLWHLEETNAVAGNYVVDSGPLGNDATALNDGVNGSFTATADQTVFHNVAGVPGLGSGVQFTPLVPVDDNRKRATVRVTDVGVGEWPGGSFTLEMWVNGISMTELSTADSGFGRFLAAQSRWDWSLGLTTNGAFRLRGDPGTIQTDGLTWDSNTWYYIALVADTNGQASGNALYSFYRGTNFAPSLTLIGSVVGTAVVNNGAGSVSSFSIGSGVTPGAPNRTLTFFADEVHYSDVARSEIYLQDKLLPEPTTAALVGLGSLLLLRRRN